MKKKILWVAAAIAAFTLIGAPSTAFAADEPTYLPAPVQLEVCADRAAFDAAHWDIPEVEGVTYGIYYYGGELDGVGWEAEYGWDSADDAYLVLAGSDDWGNIEGGVIAEGDATVVEYEDGATVAWWFPEFDKCSVPVTAKAPTWSNPAGPMNLTPVYTDTAEYSYTWKRYSSGKVQVTATAKPGYVLTGTTQWQKLDSN